MATVQHPAIPSITHDVGNPDEWVEQGWLLVAADDASDDDADTEASE